MGRSGKKKKNLLGSSAPPRSQVLYRNGLPEPNADSIVLGIDEEALVYYDPETKKVLALYVDIDYQGAGDYDPVEYSEEMQDALVAEAEKVLSSGQPLRSVEVSEEFEFEIYDGPSPDRMEPMYHTDYVTIDGQLEVDDRAEIWDEEDRHKILEKMNTPLSQKVLEMIKADEEEAAAIRAKERSEELLSKIDENRFQKPAEGDILSRADKSAQ